MNNNIKVVVISFLSITLVIGIIIVLVIKFNYNFQAYSNVNSKKELQSNIEADTNNKIMLADMLKEEKDIIITEDNVDNSNKIIEKANLKKGVFIVESSREKFLEIINTATENTYSINNEGYLMKPANENKSSDLTQKINNYIDSANLIIINISSTYKGMLNDGIMLDFMIERTMYVQTFKYNANIEIALVNPDRINEKSEDLTQKEIYEEVLLGL